MIASIKDVNKRFGQVQALDHVQLEIKQGEIVGLLGPNGAGKTTMIRILVGLISADGGDIQLFGEQQHINNIKLKQHLGLVTQEITVFEELTAEENLRFFGGLYGLKGKLLKERVEHTLAFVGLSEYAKKSPGKFSGGMQRRLNIACALVHEPRLLIMDEPTVGIDPQSRSYILESVKRLAQQGTTILYTSHYMEEVQAIADRIVIMDQGHVIADGTLEELVNRIQHEEMIRITVAEPIPLLMERFRMVQGVKSVSQNNGEYSILSTTGTGNLNRLLAVAQQESEVLHISATKPNLEDVFLTLTGKKLRDEEGSI